MTRKGGRPYFCTNARYGRAADTIVLWFAYTPTGRVSKYWHILRLNGEHYGEMDDEAVERLVARKEILFPKMPKGYTWSEPYRYS